MEPLRLLLAAGADVRANGCEALHLVWEGGEAAAAAARILLEAGAGLEAEDNKGQTPLLQAARSGQPALVERGTS